jgi:hypothetical protein
MLSNLFADVVEEEGAGAKGGGKKKGGGSMQTISATHRVCFPFSHFQNIKSMNDNFLLGTIE